MVKLIVQIPCLNEEATLPAVIADIPRQVPGVDVVEVLVIDDGSTDRTVDAAWEAGADHVLSFTRNRGLGHAIRAGFDACLALGADVVVNTDGDNQYFGGDIPLLVAPVLQGRADMVVGDRQTATIAHFSATKRLFQRLGSRVVRRLAGVDLPDVASGFRAYRREALFALTTRAGFDHTVEHTIQAGHQGMAVLSVPIRTNPKSRESRLFSSIGEFVVRSAAISLRTWATYRALTVFSFLAALSFALGILLGLRFLYFFRFTSEGHLHVQSVVLSAIFLLGGLQMLMTGIVSDLVATNRVLVEESLTRTRRLELEGERGRAWLASVLARRPQDRAPS